MTTVYTSILTTLWKSKNHLNLNSLILAPLHQELKKVLTPTVLHGDREAIRAITKRVQTEETWKVAWKEMELARRAETQADLEHRMTYNAMLMELAGQAPRANNPRKPRKCSNRVSDLARPAKPKTPDDITKRSDYAGLVHVDHRHAMEARFPGAGHAFTATFTADATERSKPAFPPPEPPATPAFPEDRASGLVNHEFIENHSAGSLGPDILHFVYGCWASKLGIWNLEYFRICSFICQVQEPVQEGDIAVFGHGVGACD